ncbi:type I polyketide synthase [Ilumatobacter coccineus]|uniref:Putative omega-3 polyunsaturated fatty acid synthase PfaBC n=1 Tax=Ilumatobacter coccineus (strain NBRC 103263 / KCTC 29153 / YM16-304) TaxID=1313172 RepID=A0A6C7E932_ILUCY|nr:type I polyketide synthase [Ilumatobacter coccineus]BAN01655.1 putative omega-3 polyunsaturated fatty acid synthase PfaBC [Ilumatobacter coccineus YM16-304]
MSRFAPIAIVGRACVLPGALSPTALWDRVAAGDDLISRVPADRWKMDPADVMCDATGTDSTDRTWSDRGGYVHDFDAVFDPTGFEIPADEIRSLDPVFQWTFHTAREALRDAGHDGLDPARFGAIFGNLSFPSAGMADFVEAVTLRDLGVASRDGAIDLAGARNRFTSGLPALLLERALGLGRGAFALDAACASSLYAIKLACDRLHHGTADLMLAGAVNCADDLFIHEGFTALNALSRTGRSRPFHPDADGLVPAEGCGFVTLRRLDDAVADGDTIHGIIRGVGLSNDGRGRGMLVPSSDGQVRAMSEAFEVAGLDPTDVTLLECHATGTPIGDATELESSAQVYGECRDVPIGSLKSNTGHLITAAGVAGVIKVIEAMRHQVRPPTLHVEQTIDALDRSPFRVLRDAEPWNRDDSPDGVLRAGVSAFGFGGNNAHLVIEEPASAAALVGRVADEPRAACPIAIVGIGITAASAVGREAFTDAIIDATSCLDDDGLGRMPDIELRLAAQKFPPNDLKAALAQQLAMLQVADEALDESGTLPRDRTGVYVGMGTDPQAARFGIRWRVATLARKLGHDADWVAEARDAIGPALGAPGVLGTMPNLVANRLNSQFDVAGPSFTVSAEEHSGLDALGLAVRSLRVGDIDAALVGAVDLSCDPAHRAATDLIDDVSRPPGDAAVMLVVKRLDDAERDGNTIHAVICDDQVDTTGDLRLDAHVTDLFGHAHAASGLVHVAAAAVALRHRTTVGGAPLLASNPESGSGLPDGAGPRTVSVETAAIDGIVPRSILLAEASDHRAPSRTAPPKLHVFSGTDAASVLAALDSGRASDVGPARLVIVADSEEQFAERAERARRHIADGRPAGSGISYRSTPLDGEMAFVFTAGGAAYHGMGTQLLRALPELATPISTHFPLGDVSRWVHDPAHEPLPADYLWGTALLSQAHAQLTLGLLGLRPTAAIGYSSGETNSLYAFGVWTDMDAMRREIVDTGMLDREIGVEFAAVARAWEVDHVDWAVWNILAPVDDVRAAIADEPHVHLMLINTARDVVISGDAGLCRRLVEEFGTQRCRPVGYNLACHVPEVRAAFHEPWLAVHTRQVTPAEGVRFYSNGVGGAYDVSTEACAEAITAQAENTVDFPATIRAAYDDGVRVFVEHGPSSACSNFINEILDGHDVLAVHLDRRDSDIEQIFEVCAALVAAGIAVDHEALTERLRPAEPSEVTHDGPVMSFPAHPEPARLPAPPAQQLQPMPPAPTLPSVFATVTPPPTAEPTGAAATLLAQITAMTELHDAFVAQQAAMHERFLATRGNSLALLTHNGLRIAVDEPPPPAAPPPPAVPTLPGPKWDKTQLQIHSSGRISELFGPMFEPQDQYAIQCRMPEPPLLLADRVTGLDAEPGVLGTGTIWTETDVERDAWYLNGGYMPAGFMIESGQADLLLISYMGIDLLNQGERAYRLLGCTLVYHGDLPTAGDTLEYEIRITGHAKHGDIRLFFFEYDCIVDGARRLTVRDAQAGFFTGQELRDAQGALWTPESGASALRADARVDPPVIDGTKRSFGRDEVRAFSEGRVVDCFGPGFEWAHTHTRTPTIQAGDQLFIDEVTEFDPRGGPWGRGFMRCETTVADDAWFFDGHFKNDPCMPGNFMVEACIEAMSFYLAATGHTARADGWRFQPLPEQPFELKCRGEINPQTEQMAYELYVEEIWDGPHPTIICDVLGFVDGKPAFHAHRIGVELVPGWPLTTMPEVAERPVAAPATEVVVATDAHGFPFDWKAMISCAWGKPSDAFGSMYADFDPTRRSPRLPGEPYHFISRVTSIDGELDDCRAGMKIVCDYDIPDDAWYFDENGAEVMPYAVLLEAALQPCGWVASAVGSVTDSTDDMLFRNLDGTGTLVSELTRTSGTLTTRVELTSVSRAGGMIVEGFEVECSLGDRVVYTMSTVFGFFPPAAFEDQVGLPITDAHRATLALADGSDSTTTDLTLRPERYCSGSARLAGDMLLMLDRATHLRGAGADGLGVVVGEKDVDVSEWFFKAHFFQDPVQPGSLGIEALLQLLQFFMLDTDMDAGLTDARFEPILLGAPMTWTYRGQVTPKNSAITTVMEITEVGVDDHGPFVIGAGSLWCDGLRIYEVSNMGMRLVTDTLEIPLAITVDRERYPQLVDHAIDGTPVVPVVLVLEWFTRLANAQASGLHLARLTDLRVLSGLVVDGYDTGGHLDLGASVRTSTETADGRTLALELTDAATGRVHYRCNAELTPEPPRHAAFEPAAESEPGETWTGEIYGGEILFHGPAFQVIENVSSVSATGLDAELSGLHEAGWPDEPWATDPALLDGALQLALLWTDRQLGGPSLPTAIGSVRVFDAPGRGPYAATVTGRRATATMVACDISIRSATGSLVALLEGVETHKLPPTA